MKIKLAILENDSNYLNRMVVAFNTRYADKLEIYSFTSYDVALEALASSKIDVLVASDYFDVDTKKLPARCGFAYMVDSPDIDNVREQRAICKFQKADLIYKQILSIYSENAENMSKIKLSDDCSKLITFSSPCGGTGTSSVAAACAVNYAKRGRKVLYFNLEPFGSSDNFFSAEGQFDMSDIIYALKSAKANLSLKLESCVKQDVTGVCFFSASKIALDMQELDSEDIKRLISELQLMGGYDYIILDIPFGVDKTTLSIYELSHNVVMVGDGSDVSNTKIQRAYNALTIIEQNSGEAITNNMRIIYNKFSNKTGHLLENIEVKIIGGSPRYEHATQKQVIEQLSLLGTYDELL